MWPTSRATYRTEYISLNNKLIGQPSRQSWNCHQETNEKWFNYRSSCINCALQNDEDVYWVSIGHYEAVAVGDWWYWVSRGHLCLYILNNVKIWTGVTDALLTHSLTHRLWKINATQLLIKYKSGALVTQYGEGEAPWALHRNLAILEDVNILFERALDPVPMIHLNTNNIHSPMRTIWTLMATIWGMVVPMCSAIFFFSNFVSSPPLPRRRACWIRLCRIL